MRTAHPEVLQVVEQDVLSGTCLTEMIGAVEAAAASGDRFGIEATFAQSLPSYVPLSAPQF